MMPPRPRPAGRRRVPCAAEPGRRRDGAAGRLAAHGGDLVRLGGRTRAPQHGGHARAPRLHPRRTRASRSPCSRTANWYRHVTLMGTVVSLEDDPELHDIDRLALRYTGKPYASATGRASARWMQPERWHAWPPPK